jgi:hypothetical protein
VPSFYLSAFDVAAGVLIFIPPLAAMFFLGKWILKIRQTRQLIAQPA